MPEQISNRHPTNPHRPRSLVDDFCAAAFGMLISGLALLVAFPFLFPFMLRDSWRRRRMLGRLRRSDRLIDLSVASRRVAEGRGVLFVEVHYKGLGDTWYIDSAELAKCPECPLPSLTPRLDRTVYEPLFSDLVSNWCNENMQKLAGQSCMVRVKPNAWRLHETELPNPAVRAVFFLKTESFRE